MSARDVLSFIRAWRSHPGRVGAVLPSGALLADVITSEITPASGPVIELGAGTGVFTRALLARGVREDDLLLVEAGPDFAALLAARFPAARVLRMDAARLGQDHLYAGAPVGAVVSGLPLLNMSPKQVVAILQGAFGYLRPDGAFFQFTYGLRCPVSNRLLDRLGLKATRIGGAFFNVPPASVYRITRRGRRAPL